MIKRLLKRILCFSLGNLVPKRKNWVIATMKVLPRHSEHTNKISIYNRHHRTIEVVVKEVTE